MSQYTKTLIVDADGGQGVYTNIQSAALALTPPTGNGGVIIVERGVYNIEDQNDLIQIPSNTTLIGRGNVVVNVITSDQSAFTNSNHNVGNTNITITGFKIKVACGDDGPYNSHLIFFQNVSDCLIEKLTIDAPEGENWKGVATDKYAIYIYSNGQDCKRNTIRQCHITRFGRTIPNPPTRMYGYGIGFNRQGGTSGICCDSIVKNNYITNCLTNLYSAHSERILIRRNIFRESRVCHINITQCKNWIIKGNQMNFADSEIGSHGVYLSGCEGSIIAGNIVHHNGGDGIKLRYGCKIVQDPCPIEDIIECKNNTIIGNVCSENGLGAYGGDGIGLFANSNHNVVYGNCCIKNHNVGIRNGEPAFPDTIGYNNITGNVCLLRDGALETDYPIQIDKNNCDGVIAADNIGEVVIYVKP
jgi:hypothetical protein